MVAACLTISAEPRSTTTSIKVSKVCPEIIINCNNFRLQKWSLAVQPALDIKGIQTRQLLFALHFLKTLEKGAHFFWRDGDWRWA